jgi:hypothetical protein
MYSNKQFRVDRVVKKTFIDQLEKNVESEASRGLLERDPRRSKIAVSQELGRCSFSWSWLHTCIAASIEDGGDEFESKF